jgi:hypothetical protein
MQEMEGEIMEIDELVEKGVIDYCEKEGYSERLTKLLLNLVKKMRGNELETGDLGDYLTRVNSTMEKDGLI